jgi:hypothetical protein
MINVDSAAQEKLRAQHRVVENTKRVCYVSGAAALITVCYALFMTYNAYYVVGCTGALLIMLKSWQSEHREMRRLVEEQMRMHFEKAMDRATQSLNNVTNHE